MYDYKIKFIHCKLAEQVQDINSQAQPMLQNRETLMQLSLLTEILKERAFTTSGWSAFQKFTTLFVYVYVNVLRLEFAYKSLLYNYLNRYNKRGSGINSEIQFFQMVCFTYRYTDIFVLIPALCKYLLSNVFVDFVQWSAECEYFSVVIMVSISR